MPADTVISASRIDAGAETPFFWIAGGAQSGLAQALVGHRMRVPGDARPRGLWGEWAWDGSTLTAGVDPLGYFSLFVYQKGGDVGVSPSILHLLAQGADPEPDTLALAVFHRVGFFVGADTPFRHIRVLTSGQRLVWQGGKGHLNGAPPAPKVLDISREQAVEGLIDLPRAAIRRFLADWQGPIALPLSGGRDSRHLLLEMAHQRRLPDTCLTFHHGGRALNTEVQAARAVAQRVGVRHAILGHPRHRLRDAVRGLLMTQLCADQHARVIPMHDYLTGSPAAAVDGIGGDILTRPDDRAAGFFERAGRGDWEGIARGMADSHGSILSKPGHRGGAGAVFSPDLEAAAIDRIARAVQAYADWPDPCQAFWFFHRTRREFSFAATAVMGGAAMVFCPYLDPDFVELGLSLPWSVTCDQKLHGDAIARAFPAFADLPFASGLPSQILPGFRLSRITDVLDIVRIAAVAGPRGVGQGVRAALAASPLWRDKADIYRLHGELVAAMSAREARRLIGLGARLSKSAPKGERVVSRVHPGR